MLAAGLAITPRLADANDCAELRSKIDELNRQIPRDHIAESRRAREQVRDQYTQLWNRRCTGSSGGAASGPPNRNSQALDLGAGVLQGMSADEQRPSDQAKPGAVFNRFRTRISGSGTAAPSRPAEGQAQHAFGTDADIRARCATSPNPAACERVEKDARARGIGRYRASEQQAAQRQRDVDDALEQSRRAMEKDDRRQAASGRCDWPEAKLNIDWVVSGDAGARQTFMNARGRGLSCYDSVLAAQGHNGNAQASIRACGARSEGYVDSQAACSAMAASRPEANVPRSGIDDVCGGKPQKARGTEHNCPNSLQITVVNQCPTYVDIQICIENAPRGPWGCNPFFNVAPGSQATYAICDATERARVVYRSDRKTLFSTPLN